MFSKIQLYYHIGTRLSTKLRVPEEKEGEGFERDDAGIYILLVKKNSFSRNWSLSFPLPLSSTLVVEVYLHVSWVFLSSYERLPSNHTLLIIENYIPFCYCCCWSRGKRHALVDYICCSCDYCVGGCDSC